MSDSLHRQEFWFQNSWFESQGTSSLCLHSSVVRLDLKDLHSWKVSKAIIYRTKKIGVGIFGNLTNRFHFDSWDHESIQNKCMSILHSKSILLTLFLTSGSEKDVSTSSHQLRSVQERYPSENKTRQDCTKISLSCDAPLTSRPRSGPPSQKQLIRGPQATTGSMTITAQEMVTNNLNVCGQTALVLLLLAPVLNMHLFVSHSSTEPRVGLMLDKTQTQWAQ